MKAIINDMWRENPLELDLKDAIVEQLDYVEFYEGRDVERVLKNVLESHANLIDVLAGKGIIAPEDVQRIVPGLFVDAFDND